MIRTAAARLHAADEAVFRRVALRRSPLLDRVVPRLTTSADRGLLWYGVALALIATGDRGRRAAARGLTCFGVASAVANGPAKWAARRPRPVLTDVPALRRLSRQPRTTSFPSGHSASAAAFATGVALESPAWALPVAAIAAGVAYGRVHTGVHYPGDVVAGVLLGAGCAVAVGRVRPPTLFLSGAATALGGAAPALPDGGVRRLVVLRP